MAITFLEKRKRLQYLFPILGVVILITVFTLWKGFFAKEKIEFIEVGYPLDRVLVKEIEIDFETLKSPELEELQLFEEVPPYEGEIGRENPFTPY